MRSRDPRAGRCRRRPILEGLESRDLPSALVSSSAGQTVINNRILQQAATDLYPANVPPGTPTATEIRRQTFTARWVGKYTIGPPRFSDRADTIHLYGVSGGANQFLKGKFNIAIFPPANPAATPTPGNPYANQITGVAALYGQNYLQSGSMVLLDLNGTPPAGSAPDALPTQLSWTFDANASAGPYAAPGGIVPGSGFTLGAGAMRLQWTPDAHPLAGTAGSGRVVITFLGLINTSQITSAVSKRIS
jgi:hypothetical protein